MFTTKWKIHKSSKRHFWAMMRQNKSKAFVSLRCVISAFYCADGSMSTRSELHSHDTNAILLFFKFYESLFSKIADSDGNISQLHPVESMGVWVCWLLKCVKLGEEHLNMLKGSILYPLRAGIFISSQQGNQTLRCVCYQWRTLSIGQSCGCKSSSSPQCSQRIAANTKVLLKNTLNVVSIPRNKTPLLVKGAICKNWPPIKFTLQTNGWQHITTVR